MFGNMKGWIISGVLFLFVGFILVLTGRVPPISPPTGKVKLDQKIAVPGEISSLLPPMDKDGDAADTYRQAIKEYAANGPLYAPDGKYRKDIKLLAKDDPKGIQLIAEATNFRNCDLFASKPEAVVNYQLKLPDLEALSNLGELTINAGVIYRQQKDLDKAGKYMNAGFALGYRLYSERLVWEELNTGLNLMLSATTQLGRLAKDRGEAEKAEQFAKMAQAINEYKTAKVVPIAKFVTSIQTSTIGEHAGDIFGLLRQNPERMWKVEALLSLGRMRFNAPRDQIGDQIGATREVKKYLNDPDPAIKQAAGIAAQLTRESYRMIGN
jgi:tetratricopeptide (TPR) repeat protein